MTLPATWAEKGKAILPLSGICVRKPQFSKPLDEEDDLRLSNMNFFKVSDLKLKKTITPVVYTGTIRERQMKNYIDYLSASLGSDRKSTRLNSSHSAKSRMPSSA